MCMRNNGSRSKAEIQLPPSMSCMIEMKEMETGFLRNQRESLLYAACLPADTAAMGKSYGNSG